MNEIHGTLYKFREDLQEILEENLCGIVIHGSYVLGDFQANLGDLDFIVTTETSLDEKTNRRLFSLHKKYRSEKLLLLHQLEGAYYPEAFLRKLDGEFLGCYIGTSRMKPISTMQNSYMDLRLINQHGLMLAGSNICIYNPGEEELLEEQRSDCLAFKRTALNGKQVDTGFWISAVHWSARTLFYQAEGVIGSKTQACKWCSEQSELEEFRDLFSYVKLLRYPYRRETLQEKTKVQCSKLLEYVDTKINQ